MDERADSEGPTAFRRWIDGLPRPVRWLLGVVFIGAYYVLAVLVMSKLHHGAVDWSRPLPGLLGGLGGAYGGLWWRNRRMGGRQKAREFERAVKTGRLPTDTDPSVWRRLLDREQRGVRRAALVSYVLFGLVGALVVVLDVVRTSGRPSAADWIVVAVLLALAGVVAWTARRQGRRIQRLLAQLPEDPISGH